MLTEQERNRLNYLRDKEMVCCIDKEERYELRELEAKL